MMNMFPPSPALSVCDSLDGIDDLDAFLDAKGRLSHFPTPPLKKALTVDVVEISSSTEDECAILDDSENEYYGDDEDDDDFDDISIAELFAEQTCLFPSCGDIASIRTILIRSQLPVEVLALAYNILSKLGNRHHRRNQRFAQAPDLLVISCLALAEIYTDDHPAQAGAWARDVADGSFTATQIDSTMLAILDGLEWRLHSLTAPDVLRRGLCILAGFLLPDLGNDLRLEDVEGELSEPALEAGVDVAVGVDHVDDGNDAAVDDLTTTTTVETGSCEVTDVTDIDVSQQGEQQQQLQQPLKLLIEQSIQSASWVNGLLTPDTAPTSPILKTTTTPSPEIYRYLPLL